jgi:hypothetical protein
MCVGRAERGVEGGRRRFWGDLRGAGGEKMTLMRDMA